MLELGQVVATPGVIESISQEDINEALDKHRLGNWGNVCDEDWETNNEALNDDGRVLSSYTSKEGNEFWILSEGDRSSTTVLLPSEY